MKLSDIGKKAKELSGIKDEKEREEAIGELKAEEKGDVLDSMAEISAEEDGAKEGDGESKPEEKVDPNKESKELIGRAQGMQSEGDYNGAIDNIEKAIEVAADKKMAGLAKSTLDACLKSKENAEKEANAAAKAEEKEAAEKAKEEKARAGRKVKPIEDQDIINDVHALILKCTEKEKQNKEAGGNGVRFNRLRKYLRRSLRWIK